MSGTAENGAATMGKEKTEFLDSGQYTVNGITRYERIFGRNYVSEGGLQSTQYFTGFLKPLPPGARVLDMGCGIGGSAFFLAKEIKNVGSVLGVDISENMLNIARTRRDELEPELRDKISFRRLDLEAEDPFDGTFDLIYSRDCFMHIVGKAEMYKKIKKWLKPGGQVLMTTYVVGVNTDHPDDFKDYLKNQRGYILVTRAKEEEFWESANFEWIKIEDKKDYFVNTMQRELRELRGMKTNFIKELGQKNYDDLESGWEQKLKWCAKDLFGWGFFRATKAN